MGSAASGGDATTGGPVDFTSDAPIAGNLDVRWIHGSASPRHNTDPKIQVHAYDPHTFVLRQNMAVHREAPFLYLFCGNDRALLLDTGAHRNPSVFDVRGSVDGIVERWLTDHPRAGYQLTVAHSHAHYDHIAADSQFAGRPDTTVVGTGVDAVRSFFGLSGWPAEIVRFDLGGRVLEVTGCPGHHDTSIAVYDPWSGFLVSGDTVYPGRLYVNDFPAFTASLDRLVEFARSRPVTHVMGGHIEMTRTPGRDYPVSARYQPDEPPLEMTVDQLVAVRNAAASIAARPGVHVFADFIIFNGRCLPAMGRHGARGLWAGLRRRVRAGPTSRRSSRSALVPPAGASTDMNIGERQLPRD